MYMFEANPASCVVSQLPQTQTQALCRRRQLGLTRKARLVDTSPAPPTYQIFRCLTTPPQPRLWLCPPVDTSLQWPLVPQHPCSLACVCLQNPPSSQRPLQQLHTTQQLTMHNKIAQSSRRHVWLVMRCQQKFQRSLPCAFAAAQPLWLRQSAAKCSTSRNCALSCY
jgi:hypothetical protein